MKPLGERLRDWGRPQGLAFGLSVYEQPGANYGQVVAKLGPIRGYGYTTNEAINALADGLVEEGWPDDRPPWSPPFELRPNVIPEGAYVLWTDVHGEPSGIGKGRRRRLADRDIPVVPCDEAAIDRAVLRIAGDEDPERFRLLVEQVFEAAAE